MGSGFALDSIKTSQNNRLLKQLHRARYNEMKDAVSKIKARYPHKFVDRNQLSDKEFAKLKKKIRNQIVIGRKKSFITTLVISILICVVIYFAATSAFNYFYNN